MDRYIGLQEITEIMSKTALALSQTSPGFYMSTVKSFENTVGKEEIANNEQFLFFLQGFLPIWRTYFHFQQVIICCLQTLSVWRSLNFVVWERVKHHTNNQSSISSFNEYQFLAQLLWNKKSMYSHDPGIIGVGIFIGVDVTNFYDGCISVITEESLLKFKT